MTLRIQKIDSATTYSVRQAVLRPGKPLETCHFSGDDLPTTLHWGAYLGDHLVGILSVYAQSHASFTEEIQFQLRGMAVLPDYQGQSIGQALLLTVESALFSQSNCRIWFNARTSAIGFYSRFGYTTVGDTFEIPDVGPHCIMTKTA
ncbi:MAG: hypothetical protein RL607_1006 [Bacteroidota bacterium]|jgi:ribosomal protein S18 acetylase RimI-like enzyme